MEFWLPFLLMFLRFSARFPKFMRAPFDFPSFAFVTVFYVNLK
jgi:hypothetical protein